MGCCGEELPHFWVPHHVPKTAQDNCGTRNESPQSPIHAHHLGWSWRSLNCQPSRRGLDEPFRPKWKLVCQYFDRYPGPSRCSKGHTWCAQIWHGSIRRIQARPAGRRKTKGSVPWQNNEEEAEDMFRYPKENFCKQLKQRHSTRWQESTCSHGPGGRKPPSPDERCPFLPTRANGDGAIRKTNKAALARELERQVLPAETTLEPSANHC